MGEQFKASDVQFHRDQALRYEREATGYGDSVMHAQLAVMHATLAVAATNLGLYELHAINGKSERQGLDAVESGLVEIAKALPPR